jgi:molecular chaperone GrpE
MNQDNSGPDETAERAMKSPGAGQEGVAGQPGEFGDQSPVAALAGEIEALKAENHELKDRSLRLIAEMENLRRRTERDKAEFSKYAVSEFARDVLSVGDNLRRAIQAVPQDALATDQALRSLVEGVEVTEKELVKALEKYQVKRFDPTGEPFNPHLHDAMTRIEVPNVPADTVVQVIQAGYMIGERVLRPASVIVAKEPQNSTPPSGSGDASGGEEEPIPPGAMKVPEEIEAQQAEAQSSTSQGARVRVDVQQSVLGREYQGDRRRPTAGTPNDPAQFRRPRSPAGDQSFREVRTTTSPSGSKPSALHKPVINNKGD